MAVCHFLILVTFSTGVLAQQGYEAPHRKMIADINAMVVDTRSYTGIAALDEKVMQAMAMVPRHEFVPHSLREFAYLNNPLPIGEGQTISQPYIVALMTHLMNVDEDAVVWKSAPGQVTRPRFCPAWLTMFTPLKSLRCWASGQRIRWPISVMIM